MTVAQFPDRIVVTWITRESEYHVSGEAPVRFQAVLDADGSIRFNYAHVPSATVSVGLFPNLEPVIRGHLLASISDDTDSDLPGHLDVLDAAIYATNAGSAVILEFTLREPILDPSAGEFYTYRLHFDTDEPYWNHPLDWSDEDATWQIDVREGGEYTAWGTGVRQFLHGEGEARISLLADATVLAGDGRELSAMAIVGAAHFRDEQWVQGDYDSRALLEFSPPVQQEVDLSALPIASSPGTTPRSSTTEAPRICSQSPVALSKASVMNSISSSSTASFASTPGVWDASVCTIRKHESKGHWRSVEQRRALR